MLNRVWFKTRITKHRKHKTPNHKTPNLNTPKLKITFHNGTEITMFPMRDLNEWYIDQLISTRRIYMLSRRSRFIKQRGLQLLPNLSNVVRWPLDLAALTNRLLRLYIYICLGEMSWSIYRSSRSRIRNIVISAPLWKVMAMLPWVYRKFNTPRRSKDIAHFPPYLVF